ncbi:hypothetical protein [Nonomuraea sp. NPDC050691]|uniref:hypothetical protein n=1 Tax=Nonomuraea sp. NPDC050691 TaxID=3155661 RepID=UPI0033CC0473
MAKTLLIVGAGPGLGMGGDRLGPVDVLTCSPSPTGPITGAAATTPESAAAQIELHVLGAVTAAGRVLPGMRARGAGTVSLTTGVSSAVPAPFLANVGTVTIATGVVPGGGEGDPDAIGARYLRMHEERARVEEVVGDLDAFRALVAERAGADS